MFDQSIRQAAEDFLEDADDQRTHAKGVVTAYDPATQKADIQPMVMRRRKLQSGDFIDERLPVIPSVPIDFFGTGKFELIADVEVGDRVKLHFYRDTLEEWLTDGSEAPGSFHKRGALQDCTATLDSRSFGDPRIPVDKGVMRIGCVDGPQIIFDNVNKVLILSSPNEIRVQAQIKLRLDSEGDVFIQECEWDPFGGDR